MQLSTSLPTYWFFVSVLLETVQWKSGINEYKYALELSSVINGLSLLIPNKKSCASVSFDKMLVAFA